MIAKTAEGLIGANNAINVMNTPMKVFKEARARGDKATMDRAMDYVEKSHDEVWEKKYSTDEGLRQEAEENKLKAEQAREELTERIRESREALEEKTENIPENIVQKEPENDPEGISGEEGTDSGDVTSDIIESIPAEYQTAGKNVTAPVTYNKSGGTRAADPKTVFSVTV